MKGKSNVLCKYCAKWVDCSEGKEHPMGFCLVQDLFTYTEKVLCDDFTEGVPMTESEWEQIN